MDNYITRVEQAIAKAEKRETKLTESQLNPNILPGMSGKKSRIMLNELIQADTKYLEVGVYVGSTFISACYKNNPISVQSIDMFTEVGRGFKGDYLKNIESNKENLPPFEFYEEDCFNLKDETKAKLKDINCFFFDGPHEEADQCKALTYYKDFLADTFIFIVDDWNWDKVKQGTFRGIKESNLEILKSWELISPGGDHENWWNSWYVAVLKKNK